MSSSNDLREKLEQIIDQPQVAYFIYYAVIVITGFMILSFLSRSGFQFFQSVMYMTIWLVIIILLDPPEQAQLQSDPFGQSIIQ